MAWRTLKCEGPGIREAGRVHHLTLVVFDRRVAEGSPHPLEGAGLGVEHGDAAVAVAVGHEQLVGRRMDLLVRGSVDVHRVGVALAPVPAADLHDERAVLRELHQLVVVDGRDPGHAVGGAVVAAQPDEALVVDVEAVLPLRPLVAVARTAPCPDEVAVAESKTTTGGAAIASSSAGSVSGRCRTQTLSCASMAMLDGAPSFIPAGTVGHAPSTSKMGRLRPCPVAVPTAGAQPDSHGGAAPAPASTTKPTRTARRSRLLCMIASR